MHFDDRKLLSESRRDVGHAVFQSLSLLCSCGDSLSAIARFVALDKLFFGREYHCGPEFARFVEYRSSCLNATEAYCFRRPADGGFLAVR